MVPGPQAYPAFAQQRPDIMGVQPVQGEGNDADMLCGRADDLEPRNLRQPLGGIVEEGGIMGGNGLEPDVLYEIERCAEAEGGTDGRRPGFEPAWPVGEFGVIEAH